MVAPSEVITRERRNTTCSIRLCRSNKIIKTLRCATNDENSAAGVFRRYTHFLAQIGFLVPGDINICDNADMHVKRDNYYLKEYFKSIGIDAISLQNHSRELNAIELMLNVMVQMLNSEFN